MTRILLWIYCIFCYGMMIFVYEKILSTPNELIRYKQIIADLEEKDFNGFLTSEEKIYLNELRNEVLEIENLLDQLNSYGSEMFNKSYIICFALAPVSLPVCLITVLQRKKF